MVYISDKPEWKPRREDYLYRDMIYTSLAKANPAFLSRLSAYDRLEGFIDTISDFAGDAHFQIEKQIIDQYTKSEEYRHEKNDIKKVNNTLRHIDENVMKMIPDLIEQALMPGSEMMEQLEREEEEIELFEKTCRDLFRDRGIDEPEDSGAGIILEEGGLEELLNQEMPEESIHTLEDHIRFGLKAATASYKKSVEKMSDASSVEEDAAVGPENYNEES